ncbi:hypothetical protein EVAR_47621_1 [Eumeta japonica]|uniref:Uncharacterized protein n=1 Tax=Eumeta variegata TaxID=151549 RepID=A0A4C1ZTB8_EUMVA|nr:hypothetical protein EVAR_47621_1 [Eumeta japonica]
MRLSNTFSESHEQIRFAAAALGTGNPLIGSGRERHPIEGPRSRRRPERLDPAPNNFRDRRRDTERRVGDGDATYVTAHAAAIVSRFTLIGNIIDGRLHDCIHDDEDLSVKWRMNVAILFL